mgnify:FL=1
MIKIFDLQKTNCKYRENILKNTAKIIKNGKSFLNVEDGYVSKVEAQLERIYSPTFVQTVGSGSDALEIALRALEIKAGDYVAVPAMSFIAPVEAVIKVGAIPLYVDIDINRIKTDKYL